jgi:RNA polymerase sigma-70 factor, ECF subfamily
VRRGVVDWPAIVEQHGPMVWRTVYRLVSNRQDAEDCYQETFVAAWMAARREPIRAWPGLLRRLATARALDRLRQRMRRGKGRAGGAELEAIAGGNNGPSQTAEAGELAQRLRMALSQLPRGQAEVFCLRFLEEMSYEEIGRATGLAAGHVGVLLHRARGKLKKLLDDGEAKQRSGQERAAREVSRE